jgi:opacity protein-like surface antigen
MKKIYFILVVAVMFIATDAKAQFGVGVGYNLLNTTTTIADESEDDSLNGFYIEATYGFNLLNGNWGTLGIEPGLRYTFGGETEHEEIFGIKTRASFTEHYLDIPVHVKYGIEIIPSALNIHAFAGPVFSVGLASSLKATAGDTTVKTNNYEDSDYGRFDLKIGVGAGVTIAERVNVKVGYNFGMLNRYTGEQVKDFKYKTHTGVFYVDAGINF